MTDQPCLSVRDIHVNYGEAEVLRGINLELHSAVAVTLIGANGAGKTTLLKTISGVLHPVMGNILFGGDSISNKPAYEIRRMGLIHVPEGSGILRSLSVYENLKIGGLGEEKKTQARMIGEMLDRFPILRERRNQLGGALSGGERQILAIARGLMGNPRCLMLDEPSLGLAPLMIAEVFSILRSVKDREITLLVVEQNARQALDLADRAYVMELGRIIAEGTTEKILSDKAIVAAYLGV